MARIIVTSRLSDDALEPIAGHEPVMLKPGGHLTAEEIASRLRSRYDRLPSQGSDRRGSVRLGTAYRGRRNDLCRLRERRQSGYDRGPYRCLRYARRVGGHDRGPRLCLIVAASRLLSDCERDLKAGGWTESRFDSYHGRDVHGATLGLVG
jgi:hypothetical protein